MSLRNWSLPLILGLCWLGLFRPTTVAAEGVPAKAAEAGRYGTIAGQVTDRRGVTQSGVPVTVTRQDSQFVQKVFTNSKGRFALTRLLPGNYAVAILLPSYLPFWKAPVSVQPGKLASLQINLWTLAESLEVGLPQNASRAREEWKWILRSAAPTRPILRFLEETESGKNSATLQDPRERALRGTVQVSAGAGSRGFGNDPGLHTTFAMEYNLTGTNVVGLAGSAGWERGTPASSFRTSWNRRSASGSNSSFSATVRQLSFPGEYRPGSVQAGKSSGERIQSMTIGYEDETPLANNLRFHYGMLFDTINIGGRVSRWSPFGHLTYTPAEQTRLRFGYTAAAPRVLPSGLDPDRDVMEQLLAIPQISSNGSSHAVLERGRHFEASLEQELGSRYVLQAAAFYDSLSDRALSMGVQGAGSVPAGLLRDPFSNRYFLSGGDYSSPGARTAIGAKLSENSLLVLGYSFAGGLRAVSDDLAAENSQALRDLIQAHRGHALVLKMSTTVPATATQISTSYKWVQNKFLVPIDPYDRGMAQAYPYLNVVVLQPLPSPGILPVQIEALADFHNLLAQGYMPVQTPSGPSYVFPAERSFRGGFTVIF
ncbi:MAG: carboxypeptidase-like regulatory domain-containing protein [Acidobacteria bacterium]|nr:carboxypeptidase-like regulatory domain-containing protein [Acidobacteriota bacterium]